MKSKCDSHMSAAQRKRKQLPPDAKRASMPASVEPMRPTLAAKPFSDGRKCSIVFYAFDLLHLDGFDLTGCPLIKRKALLKRILPKDNTGRIRFTDHIAGNGEALFEKLEALNLEGKVMKRKDCVYAFTRCGDWLKV